MKTKISKIDPNNGSEADYILYKHCTSRTRKGYIEVGDDGYCMPSYYEQFIDRVENMEVRDDDVWVVSNPKTGTTWTQEMAWCIGNNLDFEGAKELLQLRFPFLELSSFFEFSIEDYKQMDNTVRCILEDSVSLVENKKSPRYIKSHFAWDLLPKQIKNNTKKPKIIYVARNPKDTCVSFYYHYKYVDNYTGTFEEFVKLFLADRVYHAPFWKNIISFWNRRHQENILFIKYEDMKRNLPSVIRQVAKFMDKELTENQVQILNKHLSFESMKNNKAVNYEPIFGVKEDGKFMRSGIIGGYKADMTPEMEKTIDMWSKEQLKGTDLEMWC